MSKALVLGAAALALSAGTASAQGYGYGYGYDNGYAAPVADLTAPAYGYGYGGYGYGAPAYGYAAPAYAAPAQAGTTIIIVTPGPAPAYTAPPVVSGYYGAGVVSQPIYDYAPGYWGGRGYWRRW
jgi:hypothetical protein